MSNQKACRWWPFAAWLSAALVVFARPCPAQTPCRISNLTPSVLDQGSNMTMPVAYAGAWYFLAGDPANAVALWRTDGTPEGTTLQFGFRNEAASRRSFVYSAPGTRLLASGTTLFLISSDAVYACEGTAQSLRLLHRVAGLAYTALPIASPDGLYWVETPNFSNLMSIQRVWFSDGTVAGTRRIDAISAPYPYARSAALLGPYLLFGSDTTPSVGLWRIDTRTGELRSLTTAAGLHDPYFQNTTHISARGLLYFASVSELWITDGTDTGTARVATFTSQPHEFADFDGRVFFSANDGVHGREPWSTDGTAPGTRMEADILPGSTGSIGEWMGETYTPRCPPVVDEGRLWFLAATRSLASYDVYSTGGSGQAPRRETNYFGINTRPEWLGAAGGHRYYFYRTPNPVPPSRDTQVWHLDPSAPIGARQISTAMSYASAGPTVFSINVNGRLLFSGNTSGDPSYDNAEPCITDGTAAGSRRLANINHARSNSLNSPTYAWGHRFVFSAPTATSLATRPQLIDDPAAAPRTFLAPANPTGSVRIIAAAQAQQGLYLAVTYSGGGLPASICDLWYVPDPNDPDAAIRCARFDSNQIVNQIACYGESAAFLLKYPGSIFQRTIATLWVTNGTAIGTGPLEPENPFSLQDLALTPGPDGVLISATRQGDLHSGYLLLTDGTRAGTRRVTTGFDGFGDAPSSVALFGNVAYYVLGSFVGRADLPSGTAVPIAAPADATYVAGNLCDADQGVYFKSQTGYSPNTQFHLDMIRGTTWTHVSDAAPDTDDMAAAGHILLYTRDEPATGRELWCSDGTPAGTHLLMDIRPGNVGSYPDHLTSIDGIVYFTADDGPTGRELWRSDGTAAGTYPLADLDPGPASPAFPTPDYSGLGPAFAFTRAGGRVCMELDVGTLGPQLWAFDLPHPCDADLNADGSADNLDVELLVNAIAGGDSTFDPDFNHDGNADQADIAALVSALAGAGCP